MSPSRVPFPHVNSSSSHHTTTITNTNNYNPPPLNIEDARILDPSYLSSFPPINTSSSSHHGSYFNFGSSLSNQSERHNNTRTYLHAIPYVDSQGILHDPDYRPFPLIRNPKKSGPSPFALRKSYWETEENYENDYNNDQEGDFSEDEDESTDGIPTTPTSTTPFISYFLQTHPLKHRGPSRIGGNYSESRLFNRDNNGHGRARHGKRRGHMRLGSAYMYTTLAGGTVTGTTSENKSHSETPQVGPPTPATTTTTTTGVPLINNHNIDPNTLSVSPPPADYEITEREKERERKPWGGLLWSRSSRKDGADKVQ